MRSLSVIVIVAALLWLGWTHLVSSNSAQHIAYGTPMGVLMEESTKTIHSFAKSSDYSMPRDWVFVPNGMKTVKNHCSETVNSRALEYCPDNDVVFVGENMMQQIYDAGGKTGYVIALAHEFGHHVQGKEDRFNPESSAFLDLTHRELQADCYAGAVARYAYAKGLIKGQMYSDAQATYRLDTPNSDHGTFAQRTDAFRSGAEAGVSACAPKLQ